MKKKLQIFKRFDLFSESFGLLVDQKSKKKKTSLGGVISVVAVLVSCSYLGYLLYLYFSNKFLPKITQTTFNQIDLMEQKFEKSLFGFSFITNNSTIDILEQQTGKKYLIYYVQYSNYTSNSEKTFEQIPLKYCDDESFKGFICLDLDNQPDYLKTLFQHSKDLSSSFYSLLVQPCIGLPECASPEEINQKKELEETFQVDYIQFDDQLSVQVQYVLQQQITQVQTGIIIQQSNTYNYVSSFARVSTYFTNQNLLQKTGYEGYACLLFQLYQNQNLMQIQYPLLTEILAQFLTVLNLLFAFGFLAKMFSGSQVMKEISSIYLKEYYQNTAAKLIEDQSNSYPLSTSSHSSVEQIYQLHNEINQADIFKERKKPEINFKMKLKILIQQLFCRKPKALKKEINLQKESISQINKKLDIFEVYKDLLQIKKAIRLLLSEDQFAAIQFCGCNMKFNSQFQQDLKSKIDKINQKIAEQKQSINQISSPAQCNIQIGSLNKFQIKSNQNNYEDCTSDMVASIMSNKEQQIQAVYKSASKKQLGHQISKLESSKILEQEISVLSFHQQNLISIPVQQQKPQTKLIIEIDNHLQKIEEIINNKETLFDKLNVFLERIKSNQEISHIDIQIYSSILSKTYLQNHNQEPEIQKQFS